MIDQMLWWALPERLYRRLRDHCETCGGTRGGVRGNENVVQSCGERLVMCDYCHADEIRTPGFWKMEPKPEHKHCFPPCGLCYAGECGACRRCSQSDAGAKQ